MDPDLFSQDRPSTRRKKRCIDDYEYKGHRRVEPPPPIVFQFERERDDIVLDTRKTHEAPAEDAEPPKKRRKKQKEENKPLAGPPLALTQSERVLIIGPAPRVAPTELKVPFVVDDNAFLASAKMKDDTQGQFRPLSHLRVYQPNTPQSCTRKTKSFKTRARQLQFTQTEPAPPICRQPTKVTAQRALRGRRKAVVASPQKDAGLSKAVQLVSRSLDSIARSGGKSAFNDKIEQIRYDITRQSRPMPLSERDCSDSPRLARIAEQMPETDPFSKVLDTPCPVPRTPHRPPKFSFNNRSKKGDAMSAAATALRHPLDFHSHSPPPSHFTSEKQSKAAQKAAQLDLVDCRIMAWTPSEVLSDGNKSQRHDAKEATPSPVYGEDYGNDLFWSLDEEQQEPQRQRSIVERALVLAPTQPQAHRRRRTLTSLEIPVDGGRLERQSPPPQDRDAEQLGWLGSQKFCTGYIEEDDAGCEDLLAPRIGDVFESTEIHEEGCRTSTTELASPPCQGPPPGQGTYSRSMLVSPSPSFRYDATSSRMSGEWKDLRDLQTTIADEEEVLIALDQQMNVEASMRITPSGSDEQQPPSGIDFGGFSPTRAGEPTIPTQAAELFGSMKDMSTGSSNSANPACFAYMRSVFRR